LALAAGIIGGRVCVETTPLIPDCASGLQRLVSIS